MRGEVEIWQGDELIHKEHNLLVNGAGEAIVDMLTVSPSLSGMPSASSILDTSNYTVQAISFGTDRTAFKNNAHILDEAKGTFLSSTHADDLPVGVYTEAGLSVSSLTPIVGISDSPNPELTVLETNCDVSAQLATVDLSTTFPSPGQHPNLIPQDYYGSKLVSLGTTLSAVGASVYGAFPTASGDGTGGTSVSAFNGNGYAAGDVVFSGVYGGVFNAASSMDVSGFVNMIMSSVPNEGAATGLTMSSTSSGLCISAAATFPTDGVVEYSVLLGASDLGFANFYGGIYTLGLWSIDLEQSLLGGNSPPYSFAPLDNPRKYKLFATKHLTQNLCRINDNSDTAGAYSYKPLTLKWRIHFL